MSTYQLRRYELDRSQAAEFVSWVVNEIFPRREQFGYRVEWSYFDPENSELVWMASADCSRAEFEAKDQAWESSAARAAAVASMPKALIKIHASFVEKV